jgi:hypothetical protein
MTTSVTTHNPVRSDAHEAPTAAPATPSTPRAWAFAGVGAAVCGIGTIVTSSMVDTVYQSRFDGDVAGIADAMSGKAPVLLAFHSITTLGAVLMVVFAAGLLRRLRAGMPDSIAPVVAAAGLVGTAVVSIMGSGLDTEFALALGQDHLVDDSTAALYNHWVGTVPWVWTLAGLAGLALYAASRGRAVPRWIGRVGLVLGGLTVVLGISPLQYTAGATGALWLLVTAVGFAAGDRRFRGTGS